MLRRCHRKLKYPSVIIIRIIVSETWHFLAQLPTSCSLVGNGLFAVSTICCWPVCHHFTRRLGGWFIVALKGQTTGIYLQTKAIRVVSPFCASNGRVYQSSNISAFIFYFLTLTSSTRLCHKLGKWICKKRNITGLTSCSLGLCTFGMCFCTP